jgi:hypothetical protein
MKSILLTTLLFTVNICLTAQTTLVIYPDSLLLPVNNNLRPGVFYVPKNAVAAADFIGNNVHQNAIRTNVIESALNNATNVTSCLSLLNSVKTNLQQVAGKCDKLIFIFEKMPPWLSSSSNALPANTQGWAILNTKPPANWAVWQAVVDSITNKITNDFGISNAYFEIWNEPDLGAWTGTMNEYFTLYKTTYKGIKAANINAKVGATAVNFWANNIYWQPNYGYVSNTKADSSLIGQLLDSSVVWNKVPDFISWHNFNLSHQEFANAANYINQKLNALALPAIQLIISEWNAPATVRESNLANSFMIKAQLEFSKTTITNNTIAAWQDFNASTNEFHNDYGLITYGGIHKPAYNSTLLANKLLNGTACKTAFNKVFDGITSVSNDTLSVLISNYCPPAFIEALNHTLYVGKFTANDLNNAGYINIATNNPRHLDSIYRGLITIANITPMQKAINNSIATYQHYSSIATTARQFNIQLGSFTGNYAGLLYRVDSSHNNLKFKYDSLIAIGNTQASAITNLLLNQALTYTTISSVAGNYSCSLAPNAVALIQFKIPALTSIKTHKNAVTTNFTLYPNPTFDKITVNLETSAERNVTLEIYNAAGVMLKRVYTKKSSTVIDVSDVPNGLYYIRLNNSSNTDSKSFIKQ